MIIFLNGPPRSGKDTAAEVIEHSLINCAHYKLSRPLKQGVMNMMQWTYADVNAYEATKDVKIEEYGQSYRDMQINFFKYMEDQFGPAILGKIAVRAMHRMIFTYCVISDAGRTAELMPIIDTYGLDKVGLITIKREDCSFKGDIREYISNIQFKYHAVIENDFELEIYQRQVKRVLEKWEILKK